MSAVNAIERADGSHSASELRKVFEIAKDPHCRLVVAVLLVLLDEVCHLLEQRCDIVVLYDDALRKV